MKQVAISKRLKISKAQEYTLIEVLVASLILGVAVVFSIFLIKYISFNGKVSSAKADSISNYEKTLINVGICQDLNGNGKLENNELEQCDPNNSEIKEGTLRYNIMEKTANDANLESVARDDLTDCYESENKLIDFRKQYQEASTDDERDQALDGIKKCSALRVIPDALPAQQNTEAAIASLNSIFLSSGLEPKSLTPVDDYEIEIDDDTNAGDLGIIAMGLSVESNVKTMINFLNNLEKSVREFNFATATIEWSGDDQLDMSAQVVSYYANTMNVRETTKTVNASKKAKTQKGTD